MNLVVGIPRALLYFHYHTLWETFLEELHVDFVVSPPTNKEILQQGMASAISESCVAAKIFLGHAAWLAPRCDKLLVPRVASLGSRGTVCTKFQALFDVVRNTFRDEPVDFLDYNLESGNPDAEPKAFVRLGRALGFRTAASLRAYWTARQAQKALQLLEQTREEERLREKGLKVLLIGHPYNLHDDFAGRPIRDYLRQLGAVPILGHAANTRQCLAAGITTTMPWAYNKELVGAIALWKDHVDGIVLVTSFPCGPDSLANDLISRRIKDKPILTLIMDEQDGRAGVETRLESFLDIITFQRNEYRAGI